ncbi:hypothetical protein IAD21_01378 [Abditibacteriota bacterium]|nr:hypothetical protein IAD21_01378 [Abditibacteriota bacterium]
MKFWIVSLVILGFVANARADVRVVTASFSSNLLQLKSLEAKIEIKNGFALTHSTWTFSNSSDADFEAETTVEAPRSAVVSGFAYWFRGQKVVARVVERERAERLYRELVHPPRGRPRDPALVEMLSRHFFRAHIAPVAARQDLKIEVVWMQPFTRTAKEQTLDFPLSPTPQTHVDKWTVQVVGANPTTNCGVLQQGRLSGDDRKPLPSFLHLSLPLSQTPSPLISSRGGFFATTGAQPRGAKEVFRLTRGGQKLVVGRWQGAANTATEFGDVAHTLWSAAKLDSLEGNEKNRAEAIHLSTNSGLLCGWTRWLAIPDSERKRLMEARAAIVAADKLQEQGPQLLDLIAKNKATTPQFLALQAAFEINVKTARRDSKTEMKFYAEREMGSLHYSISGPRDGKKPLVGAALEQFQADILQQMARMKPFLGDKGNVYIEEAQLNANRSRLTTRVATALENFHQGREDDTLNREIRALVPLVYPNDPVYDIYRSNKFQELVLRPFANEWGKLPTGDAHRTSLEAKMRSLTQSFPDESRREQVFHQELLRAEYESLRGENERLHTQLAEEVIADRDGGPVATQLRAKMDALRAGLQVPLADNDYFLSPRYLPVGGQLQILAREIQREKFSDTPDENKIAANEKEVARLQPYWGQFDPMKSDTEGFGRELEPQLVKRWQELTSQPEFNHETEQKLVARYEAVFALVRAASPSSSFLWGGDAKSRLADSERNRVEERMVKAVDKWFVLENTLVPDAQKSAEALAGLDAAQKGVYFQSDRAKRFLDDRKMYLANGFLEEWRQEITKPHPDSERAANLERRFMEYAPYEWFYQQWQTRRTSPPQEFQRQRMDLIQTRTALQKAVKAHAPEAQIAELKQRENQLHVRVGDPLIAVKAPQNARSIVALLPSGELLPLRFNLETKQWEARFDIPTYRGEGEFGIQIFLVFANGTRSHLLMRLNVDLSDPSNAATLKINPQNPRLELECDASTDRVSAFFPSGERIELGRESNGRWSALLPSQVAAGEKVRFVLTDAAHNRTEITLDLEMSQSK